VKNRKDLGRRLRDADPGLATALGAEDEAAMRRNVLRAAGAGPKVMHVPRMVGWAAVATVIAALLLGRGLLRPHSTVPREAAAHETPSVIARPPDEAPAPVVAATTSEATFGRPWRAADRPGRSNTAERASSGRPTQIMFTAPEGTRIFWFVGGRSAKEDAS
jgi:hypothetical protein